MARELGRAARLAATTALMLAGGAGAAFATPTYAQVGTIALPSGSKPLTGFDITSFDANTQLAYVADRSNATIDVFSAATNSAIGSIGTFVGVKATTSVSGPDGVVVVNANGQHVLWAGDGNSTEQAFNLNAPGSPSLPGTPINTGGAFRVDESAYAPGAQKLLVANNADNPPFISLIDTTTNTIAQKVVFDGKTAGVPNATGGIEASAYNAADGKFYLNLVQVNGTGPGAVAKVDPTTGAVLQVYDLAAMGITTCAPAGISAAPGGQLFIGCGTTSQNILFNPAANGGAGAITGTFAEVTGADEVWCDPTSQLCFAAERTASTGIGALSIVDPIGDTLLQNITDYGGAHSVSVDPVSGEVFVPEAASLPGAVNPNAACATTGCIAVFAQVQVPEPGTLALMVGSVLGLLGLRRRFS